jgi:predicted ATPase/class 3 adenylate cyclase
MFSVPSGTVTFLFTDIEGSTRLAQQYPDQWEALRGRHHTILHAVMDAHNGYVFQVIGDAFCVAFYTINNGLIAAVEAQRKLVHEDWGDTPIKVRMGLHTGSAELHGNDYRGYLTMAKAQRVMSVAYGGQVLLSNASAELIRGELPPHVSLFDMGEHRLKGILNPEHLWQVCAPKLPQEFPPLQSLNSIPNNLPAQLTSFVGREKEIVEIRQELETHRLVTLTGSGGTGKTRLSLQVAAELLDRFPHGVWFVELAPLTDPELIPQTILSTIGISEQPEKTQVEILKEYLHDKRIMIVLDNCEHLIEASARVANDLLNAALNLKILASSREALGVKGEVSYPVPSLSLPDIKHLPVSEQLSQYEAVRLFIDRALLVAPHFEVDKNDAPFIAQICYRLDGIPLAIELAAARVKVMSVEQISKRLDNRFRLLTGGARTSLPRQQTLRALIDWSYDLLSESERLLLRRLSVFAGGWTLEAAEEVCVGQDDILSYAVLDLLTQLINKSLVVVMEHSQSGETRYRMLETIRQYAREKLLEAGGSEIVRQRHLAYFVKLAKQAEPELYRSNQVFWLNKLDDELDNLRMALEWALTNEPESGLYLVVALQLFWEGRGDWREWESWLSQFLERYDGDDSLRAQALAIYSEVLAIRGELNEAGKSANQSLELARTISDKHVEALSLLYVGGVITLHGDLRQAIPLVEQSLALYKLLDDIFGQANALAWLSSNNNDIEHSKAYITESLRLYRELGHLAGIAGCLNGLAQRMIWEGDFSSPIPLLEEASLIYRQLGSQIDQGYTPQHYGILAYWQGDYLRACAYYQEANEIAEKAGNYGSALWARVNWAYAVLGQGDTSHAKEMFSLSIQLFEKSDNLIGVVYAIEGLANLNVNQGHFERAARLFAWADAVRMQIDDHRPPVEQASVDHDLAVIQSQLDDVEFEKLSAEGRSMTVEQAIALATES